MHSALPIPRDAEVTLHPCIAHASGRGVGIAPLHWPHLGTQSRRCMPAAPTALNANWALRLSVGRLTGEGVDRASHETPLGSRTHRRHQRRMGA
jgi:hypothetical protein